jgi:hypothetical protein
MTNIETPKKSITDQLTRAVSNRDVPEITRIIGATPADQLKNLSDMLTPELRNKVTGAIHAKWESFRTQLGIPPTGETTGAPSVPPSGAESADQEKKGPLASLLTTTGGALSGVWGWTKGLFSGIEESPLVMKGYYYGCIYSGRALSWLPFGGEELVDYGYLGLSLIGIQEAIQKSTHKEKFTSSRAVSEEGWLTFRKENPEKTERAAKIMADEYITKMHATATTAQPMHISFAELSKLKNPDGLAKDAEKRRESDLRSVVSKNEKWAWAKDIQWKDNTASMEGKKLTLSLSDIDPTNGEPNPNSKAAILLDAKKAVSVATTITIGDSPDTILDWKDNGKALSLPSQTGMNLAPFNTILNGNKHGKISRVVFSLSDRATSGITTFKVEQVTEGTANREVGILRTKGDQKMIDVIATDGMLDIVKNHIEADPLSQQVTLKYEELTKTFNVIGTPPIPVAAASD